MLVLHLEKVRSEVLWVVVGSAVELDQTVTVTEAEEEEEEASLQ